MMNPSFLLPFIGFILTFLLFKNVKIWGLKEDGRTSFLYAAVVCGLYTLIITEVLSPARQITLVGLAGMWGIFVIAVGVTLWRRVKENPFVACQRDFTSFLRQDRKVFLLMGGILFIVLLTAITAFFAPPNNWDSLTYHMARVPHWIQNHSVAHYPTSIVRQLSHTPFAEFVILHLQVLSGSDRWANFVQWFSLIGCAIVASLWARRMGLSPVGQALAAAMVVSIPMGILQASSTQNDYVAGFWLMSFVYLLYEWFARPQDKVLLAAGVCLGLGFLTKSTVYIYAAPFLLAFGIRSVLLYRFQSIKYFLILGICALAINLPHYLRNYAVFGNIFSSAADASSVKMSAFEFGLWISNIIRNVALHFGTPFRMFNGVIEQGVKGFHDMFHISMLDMRASLEGKAFSFPGHPFHEDHAGNFLHLWLGGISIALLIIKRKDILSREPKRFLNLLEYFFCIIAGFLLFSAIIKWQPYHSRLHLPLFILSSPAIAVVMMRVLKEKGAVIVGVILLVAALPWALLNQSRPIIAQDNIFNTPRHIQYFRNNLGFRFSYEEAIKDICFVECPEIGLQIGPETWEYPLWTEMKRRGNVAFRIEHILTNNETVNSQNSRYKKFSPCAIITDNRSHGIHFAFNDQDYVRMMQFAFLSVYLEDKDGTLAKRALTSQLLRFFKFSQLVKDFEGGEDVQQLSSQERMKAMMNLRERQQELAGQIDREELKKIYPRMKIYFEKALLEGLRLSILGYDRGDAKLLKRGEMLIDKWDWWFQRNIKTIRRLF